MALYFYSNSTIFLKNLNKLLKINISINLKNHVPYFIYYKKLNHIFFEGETESTYSEYFVKGNIPDYLIKDMVDWLNKLDYTIKK